MAGFIEYSGVFKDFELLDDFIEEVADVSKIMNWDFEIADKNNLKGLSFTPENSDTLHFTINEAGLITKPWMSKLPNDENIKIIKVEINLDEDEFKPKFSQGNSTEMNEKFHEIAHQLIIKTSNDTEEEDLKLVEFLKYIGNKYFNDFILEYTFEEDNEDKDNDFDDIEPLEMLQAIISKFTKQLENYDKNSDESIMDFIKRVMKNKGLEE